MDLFRLGLRFNACYAKINDKIWYYRLSAKIISADRDYKIARILHYRNKIDNLISKVYNRLSTEQMIEFMNGMKANI